MPKSKKGKAKSKEAPSNQPKPNITSIYVTKYEKTRIIAHRAEAIAKGEPILWPNPNPRESIIDIAEKEFNAGMLEYIVERRLPNGLVEKFKLKDMVLG